MAEEEDFTEIEGHLSVMEHEERGFARPGALVDTYYRHTDT